MSAKLICGIDPGLSGAIALYGPLGSTLLITDMPVHEITINGKTKRVLDLYALARWIDLYAATIKLCVIEDPHAMPGQGVSSCFTFGFNCGAVQAMAASSFVPMRLVRPATWKKAMHLSADKDASRRAASQRLPTFSSLWARSKDDGRAEAALLAMYGEMTQ
jgi:crossover junction endodeoxyribonuclease RuvC